MTIRRFISTDLMPTGDESANAVHDLQTDVCETTADASTSELDHTTVHIKDDITTTVSSPSSSSSARNSWFKKKLRNFLRRTKTKLSKMIINKKSKVVKEVNMEERSVVEDENVEERSVVEDETMEETSVVKEVNMEETSVVEEERSVVEEEEEDSSRTRGKSKTKSRVERHDDLIKRMKHLEEQNERRRQELVVLRLEGINAVQELWLKIEDLFNILDEKI